VLDVRLLDERRVPTRRAVPDAEMLGDVVHDAEGGGGLLLGEQVDLQIEVRAPLRLPRHLILTDQDPDGQEDRLQRHQHGQEVERKGIEGLERLEAVGPLTVDGDPHREPDEVSDGEGRGPGRPGDRGRDALADRPGPELLRLELGDPLDIGWEP
jgi:hypothetical protein